MKDCCFINDMNCLLSFHFFPFLNWTAANPVTWLCFGLYIMVKIKTNLWFGEIILRKYQMKLRCWKCATGFTKGGRRRVQWPAVVKKTTEAAIFYFCYNSLICLQSHFLFGYSWGWTINNLNVCGIAGLKQPCKMLPKAAVCLIYRCINSSCQRSPLSTRWRSSTSVVLALVAHSGALRAGEEGDTGVDFLSCPVPLPFWRSATLKKNKKQLKLDFTQLLNSLSALFSSWTPTISWKRTNWKKSKEIKMQIK